MEFAKNIIISNKKTKYLSINESKKYLKLKNIIHLIRMF